MGKPAWATDPSTWERAKTRVRREHGINSGDRFNELAEATYIEMGGRTNRLGFGKSKKRLVLSLEKARAGLVKKKVTVHRTEGGPTKEEFRWVRPGEDPEKPEEKAKPEEEEDDEEKTEDEEGLEEVAEEETSEDAAKVKDLEMVIPEHEDAELSAAEEVDVMGSYPQAWKDPEDLKELQTETRAKFLNPLLSKIAKISLASYHYVFHAQAKKEEVDALLQDIQKKGLSGEVKNKLINAFSAQWFNVARGKKVALVNQTCTRCPRGQWTQMQSSGSTCNGSCYGGGCYVTKEQKGEAGEKRKEELEKGEQLTIHYTPENILQMMSHIAHLAGHFIRDNQNSDGSVSMTVQVKDKRDPKGEPESILRRTLRVMNDYAKEQKWEEGRAPDYVVISSCYARPDDKELEKLAAFDNLVVHVTVSGWHSKSETMHRLREFERYKKAFDAHAKANGKPGARVVLRLVTKRAWNGKLSKEGEATKHDTGKDNGARLQKWLTEHLAEKKYDVLWTPFHIQGTFEGSKGHTPHDDPASLRQLAFDVSQEERKERGEELRKPPSKKSAGSARYAAYDEDVQKLHTALKDGGAEFKTCCESGKCKTCKAKCFSRHTKDQGADPKAERESLTSLRKIFEADLASRGEDIIKTPLQQHLNVLSALYANYAAEEKQEKKEIFGKEKSEVMGEFRKWKGKILPILEKEIPAFIEKKSAKWSKEHKDKEPTKEQTAAWRENYLTLGLSGASNLIKAEDKKGEQGEPTESPLRGLVDGMLAPYGMSHNSFIESGVVSLGLSHDEKSLIHGSCRQVGPGAGLDETSAVLDTLSGTKLEKAEPVSEPRLVLKAKRVWVKPSSKRKGHFRMDPRTRKEAQKRKITEGSMQNLFSGGIGKTIVGFLEEKHFTNVVEAKRRGVIFDEAGQPILGVKYMIEPGYRQTHLDPGQPPSLEMQVLSSTMEDVHDLLTEEGLRSIEEHVWDEEDRKTQKSQRLVFSLKKAFPKKPVAGPSKPGTVSNIPGKGKAQIGEVHDWQGKKFKKVREGEWQPVEAGKGKGGEGPVDEKELAEQAKALQQKNQAAKVVANIATTVTDKVMDKMRQLYEGTLVEQTLKEGEELGEKGKQKLLEDEKPTGKKKLEEGKEAPKEEAEEPEPLVPEEEPEILKPKGEKGKAEGRSKKTEKRVKGGPKSEAKHEARLKRKKETDAKLRGAPEKVKRKSEKPTEKRREHRKNPYGEKMRRAEQ